MAGAAPPQRSQDKNHPDFKPEEKRVIFRFVPGHGLRVVRLLPLRDAGAVLRGAVLSQGQRNRRAAVGLCDLCRRLPGAAVRCPGVWAHRRSGRPQIHVPDHHRRHGRRDLRGRPAADVRDDRLGRAGSAGDLLRLLQGLALGGEYGGAATYVAEHAPNHRRGYDTAWIQTTATLGFFLALVVIGVCRMQMDAKVFANLGLADSVLGLGRPAGVLGLHPAQTRRIAGVQEDEGRGQGLQVAAYRQFPALSEQQVRAARAAGRDCRPGRGLVHGPVLRAVLPDHHAEARLSHRLHADRHFAADRHALLHLLRLAFRQDRPAQDHHGRLPDRGADLLPAVSGADALRQSRARDSTSKTSRSRSRPPTAVSTCSSGRGASSAIATGPRTS